jgi:hypothetical protein
METERRIRIVEADCDRRGTRNKWYSEPKFCAFFPGLIDWVWCDCVRRGGKSYKSVIRANPARAWRKGFSACTRWNEVDGASIAHSPRSIAVKFNLLLVTVRFRVESPIMPTSRNSKSGFLQVWSGLFAFSPSLGISCQTATFTWSFEGFSHVKKLVSAPWSWSYGGDFYLRAFVCARSQVGI